MNKTAHPDEDGTPVTPPLPDRIAAALSKLKGWAMWPDGYPHHRSAELDAAIAEVVAERDVRGQELGDARKALWDAVAERDAATKRADGLAAELDAAQAKLASVYTYANDTLSGRADRQPTDREWYREAVVEIRNRTRPIAAAEQGGA